MTGQVELGDGLRGVGTFPEHWGFPEGRATSEERTSWVLRNVAEDQALKRRGLDAAEARGGKRRRMSGHAAMVKVQRLGEQTSRDANFDLAAHVTAWQKILADLLKAGKVDPAVVGGHLAEWAKVLAKLK
jgi:hypothetical protein